VTHRTSRCPRALVLRIACACLPLAVLAGAAAPAATPATAPALAPAAAPAPTSLSVPAPTASDVGMQVRTQPCTACHGSRGYATPDGYYPRIAGKPAGYLFHQMLNFQADRRHFPMMVYLMQLQDAAYLRELAQYFAAQRLAYPAPEPPRVGAALLERGQRLVTQGDAARGVPACEACHGRALLGIEPAVPGLLGVSQDYLLGQLGAWRSGARAAYPPDCMARIARRLQPEDITAVTAWLASQPVPAGAGPQQGFAGTPPLPCGSFTQTAPPALLSGAPAAPGSSVRVERGRQLVALGGCEACHTVRGGAPFAGGRAIPTPFGTFYSPNITPDADSGIGGWSAEDFWRALHAGVSRDARLLYPVFPYTNYTRVTREDADAMYAYLRTIAPVKRANQPHALRFPYGYRPLLAAWRLLFFRPGVYQADARRSADWNRGAYLVQGLTHCSACHEARNALGAPRAGGHPSGGQVLSWYAPSLQRPDQAGLQNWSVADIVSLLQTGVVHDAAIDATALGPMAEVVYSSLQYVAPAQLRDMALYLRSLPVSAGSTAPAARPADQVLYDGAALYARRCASCHGGSGEGLAGHGPPLAGNRAVTLQPAVDPIRVLLYGGFAAGTHGDPRPLGMPPYASTLDDTQIAAVLSYVRSAWGNAGAPVDPTEVTRNRNGPLW